MSPNIGENIKKLRKSKKLNQVEFAKIIGISQGNLSDIENGKCKPSIETLEQISENFNVNLKWLVKGDLYNNRRIHSSNENLRDDQIRWGLEKAIEKAIMSFCEEINIPSWELKEYFTLFFHLPHLVYRLPLSQVELDLITTLRSLDERDKKEVFEITKMKAARVSEE
jgi:transcriptional regulator with XRE-family HTH domain